MEISKCFLLIGNTRWHWALEKTHGWEFLHTKPDIKKLFSLKDTLVAWAAVGVIPNQVIFNQKNKLLTQDIPLKNLPPWVGIDRALGAWAALQKSKALGINFNGLIVADAGTILSLTKIDQSGEFKGGQLVPGFKLQLLSMSQGAKQLKIPDILKKQPTMFPKETSEAMQRGSLQSLLGIIMNAHEESHLPIWLCGGDSDLLAEELNKQSLEFFHYPNLVLEGMVHLPINQLNPRSSIT